MRMPHLRNELASKIGAFMTIGIIWGGVAALAVYATGLF